jgi:YVTN family beta-propeller protein
VFLLRRQLAEQATPGSSPPKIATDSSGYRLDVDPAAIDADRFQQLLEQARSESASDPGSSIDHLRKALALWRGSRPAEVGDDHDTNAEIERLIELRASAFDDLIKLRFALGEYEAVLPDLRREVGDSPYREQVWANLLVALAQSGRRAEALLAYRDAESALRRELDVEPSRELQDLAARIRSGELSRAHAPANGPTTMEATAGRSDLAVGHQPSSERRGTRRRVALIAVPALALAAVLVVAASIPGPLPVRAVDDSVNRVDGDGRLTSSVGIGTQPDGIAFGLGSIWVTSAVDDAVVRLDETGSRSLQRIDVGEDPSAIATGFGSVWVANGGDRTVSRIDPTVNEVVDEITVGTAPAGIAVDEHWVWVTNRLDHSVTRIDPDDRTTETFIVGSTPLGVASAGGSVWIADQDQSQLVRMDPAGTIRDQINVGNGPSAVAAAPTGDTVWVANDLDGTVSRFDAATSVVTTTAVGGNPAGLTVGRDAVWVAVPSQSTLVKLDLATGQVIGQSNVGASPQSLVQRADELMFTARVVEGTHRGGELRMVNVPTLMPYTIDPSYGFGWQLSDLTNGALVTWKRVGGPDGLTLVPNLATTIPTSPDGGRTWTFQLRDGIRYSTGDPVRAGDVITSFARALGRDGEWDGVIHGNTSILGADSCVDSPTCDLSDGITVDDDAGTVTFHLVEPDPDFLSNTVAIVPLVPAGTSGAQSVSPLPATGPYMVDRFVPGSELHFVRNPMFRQWSAEAQPDGYVDSILFTAVSEGDPSQLVESGEADLMGPLFISAERLSQLRSRLPAQLHVAAPDQTFFEMLNTKLSPFDDPRVRQALNLATDREAILDAWGGSLAGRITCQVIPPQHTAYDAYCPWTIGANPQGRWRAPDVARARELIEQSGRKGQPVTVWIWNDGGSRIELTRYFVGLLNDLGFRADMHVVDRPDEYFHLLQTSPEQVQMAGVAFGTGNRSGSDMIQGIFTCPDFPTIFQNAGLHTGFCDRDLDAKVSEALELQARDPAAASRLWAEIDRSIVDQAPVVPVFNPTIVSLVSSRVGNFARSPVYPVLFNQLWVQ